MPVAAFLATFRAFVRAVRRKPMTRTHWIVGAIVTVLVLVVIAFTGSPPMLTGGELTQ